MLPQFSVQDGLHFPELLEPMSSPTPSSPENNLHQISLVLEQFHKDIHEFRRGRGEAKKKFGRDEYSIIESARVQASLLLPLCNLEMASQLKPFMGKSAKKFLFTVSRAANDFLNVVKFKHGSQTDDEEALLERLEPFIKECFDSVHSGSQLTQFIKPPQVILGGQHEEPIVCGVKQKILTYATYNVVKALVLAKRPLTKDELVAKSGHLDAINILKRLAKDPDWKEVIQLAGSPGKGYSIKL